MVLLQITFLSVLMTMGLNRKEHIELYAATAPSTGLSELPALFALLTSTVAVYLLGALVAVVLLKEFFLRSRSMRMKVNLACSLTLLLLCGYAISVISAPAANL